LPRYAAPNDDAGAVNLIQQSDLEGSPQPVSGEDDGMRKQSYDA
jgi:hypothetical protein